ncbi:MAG TPA: AI-2E family transporter [Desulfobacteraceae bacterium]|nr:AI-2E family transporter [Desulfobacteraceae bacterium]
MEKHHGSKFFLISFLLSFTLLIGIFSSYASSIVLALLISSVSYPLYFQVNRLFRGHRHSASLFMSTFIFIVLIIPVAWFISTLSNEAFDFYNRTRSSVSLNQIQEALEGDSIWAQRIRRIGEMTGLEVKTDTVRELATSIGKKVGLFLYDQTSSMASNLLSLLLHFFLMMLTIYYILRDGEKLKNYITQLLPVPTEQTEKVIKKFQEMGRAIIVGNGLSGIIQGLLGGLGFSLFGLPSPFLWGTILALMAFLPIIGASIIFLPATAILILQGKTGTAIGFLIYNLLYSSIIEYLIKPRMIGKGMQMNSLLVFIGIIGGIQLFGILGIIYGPLIITIFLTLAEIYRLEYKGQNV